MLGADPGFPRGEPTYYSTKISKLYGNEEKWTGRGEGGGRCSKFYYADPPLYVAVVWVISRLS